MAVLKKRAQDAWMDLYVHVSLEDAGFINYYNNILATLAQGQERPAPEAMLVQYNTHMSEQHRTRFPFSTNMFALMTIVLADLSEQQRERFMGVLLMKGIEIPKLQPETVKQVFTDLFCVPTSSLENPCTNPPRLRVGLIALKDNLVTGWKMIKPSK